MKPSGRALLAIVVLALAMNFGCGPIRPDMISTGRTSWKVAANQDNVPTKIRYSIKYEHDGAGTSHYWVYLYNGYDKPVIISYKLYFSGKIPELYDQYIFTKKETLATSSSSEPAKVEILKIVEQ